MEMRSRSIWIFAGAATAALVLIMERFSVSAIMCAGMLVCLALCAAHDIECRRIENGAVLAIAGLRVWELALAACTNTASALHGAVASLAGGAAVLAFLLGAAALMERRSGATGIGGGDVKLFAALGFCLGWETGLAIIALSCALLVAVQGLRALCSRKPASAFAFAPYIAAATAVILLMPSV